MINSLILTQNDKLIDKIRSVKIIGQNVFSVQSIDFLLKFKKKHSLISILYIDLSVFSNNTINSMGEIRNILGLIENHFPAVKIIAIGTIDQTRLAVNFVRAGAFNYLTEPIYEDEIRLVIDEVIEYGRTSEELVYLRDEFWKEEFAEVVKTRSFLMKKVFDKVRSVAPTKSTVHVTGETGTGKSLLAKLLHFHSHRANNPFISVHCGSIPDNLVESELFGHEKGAFTDADKRKLGKFEISNKGTIFLDEIGTMPINAQVKLLQVLQEKKIHRLGGDHVMDIDVRILTATNEDLKYLTENKKFRNDLFYRINVFPIEIPPLRDRPEDIEHLVSQIVKKLNGEHLKQIYSVHPEVIDAFRSYSWPGNVRELENLLERAYILESSKTIMPDKFPEEIFGLPKTIKFFEQADPAIPFSKARKLAIEFFEKEYVHKLLEHSSGKINKAALKACFTTRYLRELMEKYDIDKKNYKKNMTPNSFKFVSEKTVTREQKII